MADPSYSGIPEELNQFLSDLRLTAKVNVPANSGSQKATNSQVEQTHDLSHLVIPNILSTESPILFLGHFCSSPLAYKRAIPLIAQKAAVYAPNLRDPNFSVLNLFSKYGIRDSDLITAYLESQSLDAINIVAYRGGTALAQEFALENSRSQKVNLESLTLVDPAEVFWKELTGTKTTAITRKTLDWNYDISPAPKYTPFQIEEHKLITLNPDEKNPLYDALNQDNIDEHTPIAKALFYHFSMPKYSLPPIRQRMKKEMHPDDIARLGDTSNSQLKALSEAANKEFNRKQF